MNVGLRQPHQHPLRAIIPGIFLTNRLMQAERDMFPMPGKRSHPGMAIVNSALAFWAGKHVFHDIVPSSSPSRGFSTSNTLYSSVPDTRMSYIV